MLNKVAVKSLDYSVHIHSVEEIRRYTQEIGQEVKIARLTHEILKSNPFLVDIKGIYQSK